MAEKVPIVATTAADLVRPRLPGTPAMTVIDTLDTRTTRAMVTAIDTLDTRKTRAMVTAIQVRVSQERTRLLFLTVEG